ncbi:MAG: family 43 glycosylhydrolase [Acidimicrobiales bacterium]
MSISGALIVVAASVLVAPVGAYPGSPWFAPERPYAGNFPDPHVIFDAATTTYIAYGTNTGGATMPTMQSADLVTWTAKADGISTPSWAASVGGGAELWAPSVHRMPNGKWNAYYSVRQSNGSTPRYCITVATGTRALGPFVDNSEEPLTCGYGPAGAIDPWVYIDGANDPWLVWKTENHAAVEIADDDAHFPLTEELIAEREKAREDLAEGDPPLPLRVLPATADAIWSQRLDPTGLAFHQPDDVEAERSRASILLTANSGGWEDNLIESPALFTAGGRLHLLYSGNRWDSHEYATGWATCSSPAGPCARAISGPLVQHGGDINGPGGASVFTDRLGDLRIAYHAWNAPHVSYPRYPSCDDDGDGICADDGQRFLEIDQLCVLPNRSLHVGVPAGWAFCDVEPSRWFGPGVAWMATEEITTGISEGRFAPSRPLTRAEAVTFLWRWAGEPAASVPAPFTDVEADRYYTNAVAWAAEVGVIRGTTPTTFSPDDIIDRAQIVTILHRAAGETPPVEPSPFADVPVDSYYSLAATWAAEVALTTGVTPTEFQPSQPTTRAQIGTFLCRFSGTPVEPETGIVGAAAPCGEPA